MYKLLKREIWYLFLLTFLAVVAEVVKSVIPMYVLT
jgi:uncharacterized membrane protein